MNNESNEKRLKHLELIQGVISRMGGNLFRMRGWMITILVGLSALFVQFQRNELQVILVFVVFIFWIHDAYFLSLERSYRHLYDKIRKLKEGEIDFSMSIFDFSNLRDTSVWYCMISNTLSFFYIPTLLLILAISIF